MRKVFSIAGAALLAASVLVTPAEASHVGTLTGSCGPAQAMYGLTNVSDEMFPGGGDTVTGLFYQVNYQNVPAGSTAGIIVRYNDELESQVGNPVAFAAANATGTFASALRANISPEAQGGGVTRFRGATGLTVSNRGHGRQGGTAGSPQLGGGLTAGDYHFYVYLGEVRDTPTGRMFVADETRFVGKFSCGVSDD